VTAKREEGGRCLVDLAIQGANQRGDVTLEATATVALPSREMGHVALPEAPDELKRKAVEILTRHRELARS
jgi:hypothetical protein